MLAAAIVIARPKEPLMDIPCAILIAAFCLPESNLQLEVRADPSGSTAIAKFADVRVSIPIPSADEIAQSTDHDKQLCRDRYCIPYTSRLREDASAVDLLIAEPDGRERFIQFKGPVEQIAALSSHITFVYLMGDRWEQVALSEFKTAVPDDGGPPIVDPNAELGPEPERLAPDANAELPDAAFPEPNAAPPDVSFPEPNQPFPSPPDPITPDPNADRPETLFSDPS